MSDTPKPEELKSAFEGWFSKILGAPPGMVTHLSEADDWTKVIKFHALIESLLNQALVTALGMKRLTDVIAGLETSNSRNGKVAFAAALEIIGKEDVSFIKKFSELRNDIVHNARNLGFTFEAFWMNLDSNARASWIKALTVTFDDGKTRVPTIQFAKESQKDPFATALAFRIFPLFRKLILAKQVEQTDVTEG